MVRVETTMRPRTCQTTDGVALRYRLIDDGVAARTLVFAGGLGGTHLVWSALARNLRRGARILIWDYPGLAAGEMISELVRVDIEALAGYLETVLEAEQVEDAVLVGWSLGAQVAFELLHRERFRIAALVSICGVAGRAFVDDREEEPLAAALGLRAAVPNAVGWLSERIDRIETLRAMLRRIDRPTRWATRLGLVDSHVDELVFDAVVRDFIELDPAVYRRYVEAAAAHDATAALSALDLPVLAVAGERDRLVPAARVEELATAIRGAEYVAVRGATHFLPLEYADRLALEIEEFLERNGIP
jgi:pimeloyl-ACP methyl ester carboxylesterase